jgi:L-amino acid N-acyltransferase YncA/enamine deaminase RidA (YjgF/YER057c/UK114 family)
MRLTIRDGLPDDAASLAGILNPIIETGAYTVLDRALTVEEERAFIVALPARSVLKVAARPDGGIVGFQVLEPYGTYTGAFAHVATLGTYVDLACRRQGIARALFPATLEAAGQKGYQKIFTFVRADNRAALAAYLAHDFSVIGVARRHAMISGRFVDEILIERPVDVRRDSGSERLSHMTTPAQRLTELGLQLPPLPTPGGNYVHAVRTGSLLWLAGKGWQDLTGKVGGEVTLEQAYEYARGTGLVLLAAMARELGSLDRVARIVKVNGFVNAVPEFTAHPAVMNGCSDLFVAVFGERGRHARTSIGVASTPNQIPVEIDAVVEIAP